MLKDWFGTATNAPRGLCPVLCPFAMSPALGSASPQNQTVGAGASPMGWSAPRGSPPAPRVLLQSLNTNTSTLPTPGFNYSSYTFRLFKSSTPRPGYPVARLLSGLTLPPTFPRFRYCAQALCRYLLGRSQFIFGSPSAERPGGQAP